MGILDKVKKDRESFKINNAGRTRAYKFKVGKTVISLLPLHSDLDKPVGDRGFTREFGMHYIKNAKGENIVTVGDRSLTFNEDCPIRDGLVDMIRYANSIGDDDMAKAAKESLARKTILFNAVVHQDPDGKKDEGAQLIQFSESLNDQLNSLLEEYLVDDEDALLQWGERLAFIVEREGTGPKDTKYKIMPLPRKVTVDASAMGKAVNLEEYVQAQFDDSVRKALNFIAVSTGRAASGSALAGALTGGAGSSAPALAGPKEVKATVVPEDDDLLAGIPDTPKTGSALDSARTTDAEFEEVKEAPAKTPAATESSTDDLLAEIDALAA